MKPTIRTPILARWSGSPANKTWDSRTIPSIVDHIRDLIIESELYYPKQYSHFTEKEYGILYHDTTDLSAGSGNHAVILDISGDLNKTIGDIVAFYRSKGIAPCIYQAFRESEKEKLIPLLKRKGFEITFYPQVPLVLKERREIPFRGNLKVKRIKELDADTWNALLELDKEDGNIKTFKRQLPDEDFYLFTGENDRGKTVAMATLYISGHVSRIDEVVTHADYRNNGYATDLMNEVVRFHRGRCGNPLFLFAGNDIALHIYEKLGFEKITFAYPFWGAYMSR